MRIIIVGAGIIGAALADRLGPHADVTVVDADRPGGATSAHSLAWLNAHNTVDKSYFAFRVEAMRAWRRLAGEFGDASWYHPCGNTVWSTGEARAELAGRVERLDESGYPARQVTAAEVERLEPGVRVPPGALIAHFPDEGYVEGARAVDALAGRAREAGAELITGTEVVRLNRRGDRVTGVRLATGEDVEADLTICAAGWRSRELLATADAGIPLLDAREPGSAAPGLVAVAGPATGVLRGIVHSPGVDARPAGEDGLFLEAEDVDRATDMATPRPALDRRAAELLDRARRVFPALGAAAVRHAHRCVRPLPADGFPLVGPRRPGLYVAVTHSGMTLGPHLARLVAREIVHDDAPAELTAYRPGRKPAAPA